MTNNVYSKPETKLGLGLMGSRFLRRLNAEGWRVRGWNRSRAATLPLKEYGFAIEDTLAHLVPRVDVLLSSLSNDEAVRATYLGPGGVFQNVRPGATILEMSTISPELSAFLHQEARKRGAEMSTFRYPDQRPRLTPVRSHCSQAASERPSIAVFRYLSRSPSSGTGWDRLPVVFL